MTVAWDRDRYRQEVLEPARRGGGVPPPDLYARYGVRGDLLGDPAAFARRVADVTEYWRELTGNLSYQQLARALLAAHSALERDGPLTPVKLAAHAVAAHQEQTRRLARTGRGGGGLRDPRRAGHRAAAARRARRLGHRVRGRGRAEPGGRPGRQRVSRAARRAAREAARSRQAHAPARQTAVN